MNDHAALWNLIRNTQELLNTCMYLSAKGAGWKAFRDALQDHPEVVKCGKYVNFDWFQIRKLSDASLKDHESDCRANNLTPINWNDYAPASFREKLGEQIHNEMWAVIRKNMEQQGFSKKKQNALEREVENALNDIAIQVSKALT